MQISQGRQLILFTSLFLVIIAILIGLVCLDAPKPFSFTIEQKNQRIFSIGTLEKIPDIEDKILSIGMYFSEIDKTEAIVDIDVNVNVNKEEVFETTFVFILPHDVELYYPSDLEIENKQYAKVVYYPFTIDNETTVKTCYIRVLWPSFSINVGFGRWSFDIDCKAFHFLFDEEDETFVPLISTASPFIHYWLKITTEVSLDDGDYSMLDFHPGTDLHFEKSVTWLELDAWLSTHVTGTYERKDDRFLLESINRISFFLLGSFASLSLKIIYELVKNRNQDAMRQ